jgi:hypothetical protein
VLGLMKRVIEERLGIAQQAGDNEGMEKYEALRKSVLHQSEYTSFFMQYKEKEKLYNSIVRMVNDGSLQLAQDKAKELEKQIQYHLGSFKPASDDTLGKKIQQEHVSLLKLVQGVQGEIKARYGMLLDSKPIPPSLLPALKADLAAPDVVAVTSSQDLNEIISTLDSKFKEWAVNITTKTGKI